MKPEIDPKRTGVKAREISGWPEGPEDNACFFGEPGDMLRSFNAEKLTWGFLVACPGCGQFGGIPLFPIEGAKWDVTGGTVDDVTTLSLSPSILKHCCNWHGYLRNGIFESC